MSLFLETNDICMTDGTVRIEHSGTTCDAYILNRGGKIQFMKKLKDEYSADPKYIALFTKEFTLGEKLSHPNLVRYNELKTTSSGIYMIQDYVAGETLHQKLERDPGFFLDQRKLKNFLTQLLDCLQYLHCKQIIHLDIHDNNLMFTQVNDSLKVLDLGFCYNDAYRDLAGKNDSFAAPEQETSDISSLTARTDLYAVGRLIELIQEKSYDPAGRRLPKRYLRLASECTRSNPDERPHSARECLDIITGRSRRRVFVAAGLGVLFAIMLFLCLNQSARKVMRYTFKNIHLFTYDISDRDGNRYRITSEEDATCEAIGYKRVTEGDNPELIVRAYATHFGKTYKVTSISEKAYLNDTTITSAFIQEGIHILGKQAFRSCNHITSLTLPSTIREIGEDCFAHDSLLRHILIPEGVKVLPGNCFVDCHALQGIIIPEGVTTIEMDCFVSCLSLEIVKLPQTLERISRGVFFNCRSLREITIPKSVRTIGDYAFFHCSSLTDVYMESETPFPIASVFNSENLIIHVPEGSLKAYGSTPGWENLRLAAYRPSV